VRKEKRSRKTVDYVVYVDSLENVSAADAKQTGGYQSNLRVKSNQAKQLLADLKEDQRLEKE
jgi:hypothetical protein